MTRGHAWPGEGTYVAGVCVAGGACMVGGIHDKEACMAEEVVRGRRDCHCRGR